jgi:hypothetical protein
MRFPCSRISFNKLFWRRERRCIQKKQTGQQRVPRQVNQKIRFSRSMAIRGGSIQLIACTSGIYLESENEVVRVQRIKKPAMGRKRCNVGCFPQSEQMEHFQPSGGVNRSTFVINRTDIPPSRLKLASRQTMACRASLRARQSPMLQAVLMQ